MAGAAEILREYFVSLGFRVDKRETKNFENTMVGIGIKANLASDAIEGIAKAAINMALHYADSMQSLYRSSRHLGESAGEVQAFGFAGKQMGVDWAAGAEAARKALNTMAGRSYGSLLLGREVKIGEKPTDYVREIVRNLKGRTDMNLEMKQRSFENAGFPGALYPDLEKTSDEMDKKTEAAKARAKALGINFDKLAEAGDEWNQSLGDMGNELELLKGVAVQTLLPTLRNLRGVLGEVSGDLIDIMQNRNSAGEDISGRLLEAFGLKSVGGGVKLHDDHSLSTTGFGGWLRSFMNGGKGPAPGAGGVSSGEPPATGTVSPDNSGMFGKTGKTKKEIEDAIQNYADAYSVPADYVRAIVSVESGNGMNMTSQTGVRGLTQISAGQAAHFPGLDRNNPLDSIEMTARMLRNNLDRNGGNIDDATWKYSGNGWTPIGTNVKGGDPAYLDKIHAAIEQHNHITVNGGDTSKIVPGIKRALDDSNGNLIRDFKGAQQ